MRLLYVAYRFPYPPDKGERIRAFHQIRALARFAEVHLVCPVYESPPASALEGLRAHCASVELVRDSPAAALMREAARLVAGGPRMTGTFNSRALRRAVETAIDRHAIDCVLASTLHVAESVPALRTQGRTGARESVNRSASSQPADERGVTTIIDLVDVYSQVWLEMGNAAHGAAGLRSRLARIEGRRLERYEARIAALADAVVLSSQSEARLFARSGSEAPIAVVRNGVDLDYFAGSIPSSLADAAATDPRAAAAPPAAASDRRAPAIVFTGQMDYPPNVDAVRFFSHGAFHRLRERFPSLRFTIVGRDPVKAVRELATVPGVEVTGAVPDVRPYLASAVAAVAPLRIAHGIQNKVLEAMAMGVPVVATPAALAGLDADCGDGARIAGDTEALVAELDRLLGDGDWRRRCGAAARDYVERRHRWDDEGRRLFAVLEDAHSRRTSRIERARATVGT